MTHPKHVSLFDLLLAGHAWNIVEFEGVGSARESSDSYLATWRAEALGNDSHDLTGAPGKGAMRAVLESFIQDPPGQGKFCAAQSALAEFSLTGFEAAAVTAGMMGRGISRPPEPALHRRATIRFNRPYAVLAVGSGSQSGPGSTWRGTPVFSSWVGHLAS